jgi:hypothetical protein
MCRNKFLEIIDDKEKRVFPLNYKYVQIKNIPEQVKNRNYISVAVYNTTKYEPDFYHKPVSKIF